jgi:hypothetical protein
MIFSYGKIIHRENLFFSWAEEFIYPAAISNLFKINRLKESDLEYCLLKTDQDDYNSFYNHSDTDRSRCVVNKRLLNFFDITESFLVVDQIKYSDIPENGLLEDDYYEDESDENSEEY